MSAGRPSQVATRYHSSVFYSPSLALQARHVAERSGQDGAEGAADVGEGMEGAGCAAEPGMEPLHGPHARATHPPLQTTHHRPRRRQTSNARRQLIFDVYVLSSRPHFAVWCQTVSPSHKEQLHCVVCVAKPLTCVLCVLAGVQLMWSCSMIRCLCIHISHGYTTNH